MQIEGSDPSTFLHILIVLLFWGAGILYTMVEQEFNVGP